MPKMRHGLRRGIDSYWNEYFSHEMPDYWEKKGQGHDHAKARDFCCVVVPCSLEDAKTLAALFVNEIFAIPTCTHFNGETLSLYCGDAGGGANGCLQETQRLVNWYFRR